MKIKGGPKKVKRKPLNHDSKNAASSSNDLESMYNLLNLQIFYICNKYELKVYYI